MKSRNSSPSAFHGRLCLVTLGGAELVRVTDEDEDRRIYGPGKPLALIAYLSQSPGRSASREHLVDLLWSDLAPDSAEHAFRTTLWMIRRHLGGDSLVSDGGNIRLATSVYSDRDAFLQAVDRREFARAVDRYRGDFLTSVALPGGAAFEQWAHAERYRLRLVFLRAAEAVVRQRLNNGHCREAEGLARRMHETDPRSEPVWRLLIETCLCAGDLVSARIEADALETFLVQRERAAEPSTKAMLARARSEGALFAPTQPESGGIVAELIGREKDFTTILEGWDRASRGDTCHLHIVAGPGIVEGRSVNTRFLVGPLQVWEGVKDDVDWGRLDGWR